MIYKFMKVLNTVKFLKPKQVYYRLVRILKKKLNILPIGINLEKNKYEISYFSIKKNTEKKQGFNSLRANEILNNKFRLVDQSIPVCFESEVKWDFDSEYRLEIFKLNSLEFLWYLSDAYVNTGNHVYLKKAINLVEDWISKNSNIMVKSDIWDPYVTSNRVKNLIGFISLHKDELDAHFIDEANNNIIRSAIFLNSNVEYHLMANHLFTEATALVVCGVYTNNNRMVKKAYNIILSEISEQFTSEGFHYERSISYHLEVLFQLIEAKNALSSYSNQWKENLDSYIEKFVKSYNEILRPNMTFPLINDSGYEYPYNYKVINNYLFGITVQNEDVTLIPNYFLTYLQISDIKYHYNDSSIIKMYKEFGYYLYKDFSNTEYLLFNNGSPTPMYNLGHLHADTFNVLWSIDNVDILVDSGTNTYMPSIERQLLRSTESHNCVVIDGENTSEVWGAFRTANRDKVIDRNVSNTDDFQLISGTRYSSKKKKHTRIIEKSKKRFGFRIRDRFEDIFESTQIETFFIVLGRDIEVVDDFRLIINKDIDFSSGDAIMTEPTHISTEFSEKIDATKIVIKIKTECNYEMKFEFSRLENDDEEENYICRKFT